MQSQIVTGLIQARTPPGGSALKHNIVVSRSPESRQDGSGYWHLAGETTNRQSLGFDCPAGDWWLCPRADSPARTDPYPGRGRRSIAPRM